MKIVGINMVATGSTGKIMLQIAEVARKNGIQAWSAYPDWSITKDKPVENKIFIGNRYARLLHYYLGKITGFNGCFSYFPTKNFIRKLKKIKPDIIHLHNIHGGIINLPLLFKYIKKNNIKVVWTLQDCWSFTGQCAHFVLANCDKWKTGCHHCVAYKEYNPTFVDRTKKMWKLKKKWFTGIKDVVIVPSSQWLGDLVKQSYLNEYPIKVLNNGIDLSVFKPTDSDFRQKYNLQDKKIILGVAMPWTNRKGLDVFIELAKRLTDDYQIILVGTNDKVDAMLPKNIISIHRTQNQTELAEIYTASDVFFNPTREDTSPTVNMESLACGLPVITFRTGGSPESLDEKTGIVLEENTVDCAEKTLIEYFAHPYLKAEDCINRAKQFDHNDRFNEYIKLYRELENKTE